MYYKQREHSQLAGTQIFASWPLMVGEVVNLVLVII